MKQYTPFAIAYDFDGTLAPGNMQERDFIPQIGMTRQTFWDEVKQQCKEHAADNILIYMMLMLDKANAAQVEVRERNFKSYGKSLSFFKGVLPYAIDDDTTEKGWFDRIDEYGKQSGVTVQHYIVSSGIREMIAGTPIAKKFKAIFASSYYYDHHGVAHWPALALNYTSKTQYLFRINKGCLDVHKHDDINKYTPEKERPVPFSNMVYIGDGDTDIPCFRLVKDRGGSSIAVYKPRAKGAHKKSSKLAEDGRVNFITPANYQTDSELDRIVKALIDKVASDYYVDGFRA